MHSRDNLPIKKAVKILAFSFTLLLTLFFNYYNFGNDGQSNPYYTAAIKSMSLSWHNFFFVSFDPGGFVSADKTPVALWLQIIFVKIFGFHTWSIMLPEALATLASVALIYYLVNKSFGFIAGITAAMLLACTPIFIATSRSNNPDALLVLILLLSAWAILSAAEKQSFKFLIISAILIGIGFETKMLVAFLMVPIFIVTYLLANIHKLLKTIIQLAAAIFVLCAVSFSWPAVVDLTPANQRPYVGSSYTNSEFNLAFGYNGLYRLFATKAEINLLEKGSTANLITGIKITEPGLFRMFDPFLAGQISWFIPLAFLGAAGALFYVGTLNLKSRRKKYIALGLWAGWAIFMLVFFSFYLLLTHRYYLNIVAPGIAALAGIGFSSLLKLYMQRGLKAYLLPITLLVSVTVQLMIISNYPTWKRILLPGLLVCMAAALLLALILLFKRFFRPGSLKLICQLLSIICMINLLFAPSIWSFTTVIARVPGADPYAGPELLGISKSGSNLPIKKTVIKDLRFNRSDMTIPAYYQALSKYLVQNQGSTYYIVAVSNASLAENIILETGKPVMTIGGFIGYDKILTQTEFIELVQSGQVKYYLKEPGKITGPNAKLINWIISNSKLIDYHVYDTKANYDKNLDDLYLINAQ